MALTPCGRFCVAGAADGRMALLDRRRAGAVLASTGGDAPIRCATEYATYELRGLRLVFTAMRPCVNLVWQGWVAVLGCLALPCTKSHPLPPVQL